MIELGPLGRVVGTALLLAGGATACSLDRLITPGEGGADPEGPPGEGIAPAVAVLSIAPAETTLTGPGDGFCYRWEARDSTDAPIDSIQPEFAVDAAGPDVLALTDDKGCVVATAFGTGTGTRVTARSADAADTAIVHVQPDQQLAATLEIFPADTTLNAVGDRVCYRWTARDASGTALSDVTPTFSLRSNPQNRLSQDSVQPECFEVAEVAVINAIVDAVADTASTTASLRVRP